MAATRRRCAIYTRKSSEEGLEQSFNSLHAQREACEAYVKSQAHEGWISLARLYDDGGFSGGSMERPALRQLLADIDAGLIDVVVVYKVDRLTRALNDFARIVERFDARGVSFVSVTQAFNTTTSMGRLTLNVLLSFAQFEREVTGERIRDKIAASKKKGIWMGGTVPLGYDIDNRLLLINEGEADLIRRIFTLYLDCGSVDVLCRRLGEQGVLSKVRVTRAGKVEGGLPFTRGALYYLLQNRLYIGEIVHKTTAYPGLHKAILDPALFSAVQASLNERRRRAEACRTKDRRQAPLVGRVFAAGRPLTPSFSIGKLGRFYRYYVAKAEPGLASVRLPADAFEAFVFSTLARLAGRSIEPNEGRALVQRIEVRPESAEFVLDRAQLCPGVHKGFALQVLRARLGRNEEAVAESSDLAALRVSLPIHMHFRGGRTWLVGAEPAAAARRLSTTSALARALKQAHADLRKLHASPLDWPVCPASAPDNTPALRRARLAFLAPDIQLAILEGRVDPSLQVRDLIGARAPAYWPHQRGSFGSSLHRGVPRV